MNRLAKYLKEREGFDSIVTDEGFAAYRFDGEACWIYDIFVLEDYRRKSIAADMTREIERRARLAGCKYLYGTAVTKAKQATDSIKFILSQGLSLHSSSPECVTFRKEL